MNYFDPDIKSLSEKIHLFSERNSGYSDYVDVSVREDELKYGISKTLSKLLFHFPIASYPLLDDFKSIIESYNITNSTYLNIEYFFDKCFIRHISGHIIIPSVVRWALWSIDNKEKFKVPSKYSDALNCLKQLQTQFTYQQPIISGIEALSIFDNSQIDLLVAKGILDRKGQLLEWKGGEYPRHLRNEIISFTWMTLLSDKSFHSDRNRFLKLCGIILRFDLYWPDHLDKWILPDKLKILKDEAYEFLLKEEDILNTEHEFQKCWMDSPQYSHKSMFDPIPPIKITDVSPYAIIQQIEDLDNYFQVDLGFGDARDLFDLALRFVIQYDHLGQESVQFSKLKKLLNDTSRPHLVFNIYWNIKKNFPRIVPHLLTEKNLAPIAFLIISQLDIKREIVKGDDHDENLQTRQIYINQQKTKTEIWCETFDLFFRLHSSSQQTINDYTRSLYQILIFQIDLFYKNPTNYPQSRSIHFEARQRFEYGFRQIQNSRFSRVFSSIKPRIFPYLIQPVFQELIDRKSISRSGQRTLDKVGFEVSIQLLHLITTPVFGNEVPNDNIQKNQDLKPKIAKFLLELLHDFFLAEKVVVFDYHLGEYKEIQPRWGGYPFAYDILDWGYCIAYLHNYKLLSDIVKSFEKQIEFDKVGDGGIHEDQNNDIYTRLRLFVKAMSYAAIQIQRERTKLEIKGLQIEETLDYLYELIEAYTLKYCIDDLEHDRINILDDRYHFEVSNLYYVNLPTTIFKAIGYRNDKINGTFVAKFISENKNLALLLNISNSLDSIVLKRLLSEQIKELSVEEFISSSTSTNDWKEAMIDSINSPYHYELSVPLAERFEKHYKEVQHKSEQDELLLFVVKLHHAFKIKDLEKIQSINPPEKPHALPKYSKPLQDKKTFFIGLHWLYNETEFDKAITIFEGLISNYHNNIDYRYQIFHAKTLKAAKESNHNELNSAFEEWQSFISGANDEVKEGIKGLEPMISLTSIYYYINNEEFSEVDRLLDKLPPEFIYDEEVNEVIFDMYNKRDLNLRANSYLINGLKFYKASGQAVPPTLQALYDTIDNSENLDHLKNAFNDIYTTPPHQIIHTIPSILNGKRELSEFILHELIRAGKILIEKIKSISDIKYENKYNDVLQSILRLRLSVWNWSFPDQPRMGDSKTDGDDLGSSDFTIQAAGQNIALVEAMILEGKNQSKVEEHITKCNSYLNHTTLFYAITYFKGATSKFKSTWSSYQGDILSIKYVDGFKLIEKSFNEMTSTLSDTRNILIGKTIHQDNIQFYHIFLNIGSRNPKAKKQS